MSLNAYKKRVIWGSLTVLLLPIGDVGYKEGYEDFTGRGRTLHPKMVIFSNDKRKKRNKEEKRGHNTEKENLYWWPKIFLGHCITVVLALPSAGVVP